MAKTLAQTRADIQEAQSALNRADVELVQPSLLASYDAAGFHEEGVRRVNDLYHFANEMGEQAALDTRPDNARESWKAILDSAVAASQDLASGPWAAQPERSEVAKPTNEPVAAKVATDPRQYYAAAFGEEIPLDEIRQGYAGAPWAGEEVIERLRNQAAEAAEQAAKGNVEAATADWHSELQDALDTSRNAAEALGEVAAFDIPYSREGESGDKDPIDLPEQAEYPLEAYGPRAEGLDPNTGTFTGDLFSGGGCRASLRGPEGCKFYASKVLRDVRKNKKAMVDSAYLEARGIPWASKDELEKLEDFKRQSIPFVLNLDDSTSGRGGTHWTAARFVGDALYYADPLGSALMNGWPPEHLASLADRQVVNSRAFQRPKTGYCGYFAARFAKAMRRLPADATQKQFEALLLRSVA